MASKNTVRLWVNISPEARELLVQVAARALYNEASQPPIGQVVTAMAEWFEEKGGWEDIEETVRNSFMRKVQERKRRDRERKRKA
jgi:hypothetical protein